MRPKTRLSFFFFLGLFHFSFAGNEGKVAPSLYFSEAPPPSTLSLFFSCLCSSKVRVPSTNTSRHLTMGHLSLFFTANQIHWRIRLSENPASPSLPPPPPPLSPTPPLLLERLPSVGVATRTFTVRSRQFCRAPHPSLQIS